MVNSGMRVMLREKQNESLGGKMLTVFESLLLAPEESGAVLVFTALIPTGAACCLFMTSDF